MHQAAFHIEFGRVALFAADGGRQVCGAMITFFPRKDHLLFRAAKGVVHELHGAQSGVYGCGPAGCKKYIVEITRRKIRQFFCQNSAGLGHIGEGGRIGHFHHLIGNCICHLALTIPNLNAPHAAGPVDELLAGFVIHVNAVGTLNQHIIIAAPCVHIMPWMNEVLTVPAVNLFW